MDYGTLLVLSIVAVFLAMSIRIAKENERFAILTLGRFAGFKGPGLVLQLPGGPSKFVRITLGVEGDIQSNELASFSGYSIPYKASAQVKIGSKVKIIGFEKTAVQVEAIQQFVVCEKCGHKNAA